MKNSIVLKTIHMLNFKGIKDLKIKINEITDIFGDNGTGKTSIFDAFTWLLFGKDSSDRKDFEVKTLDQQNKVIPKIDHEVAAVIVANGEEITIRRVLKEKWEKKRGTLIAEFTGNETLFYWNEVPMQAKQFSDKITSLLDEKIFKLITNPLAFNSLKWQDARNVLVQIAGNMTDAEYAAGNPELEALIQTLSGKSFDEYRAMVTAQKKKMNVDLKEIPIRIAEVTNTKPEEKDFDGIRATIQSKETELQGVEGQLSDKTQQLTSFHESQGKVRTAIFNKKNEIQAVEFEAKTTATNQSKTDTSALDQLNRDLAGKNSDLEIAERGITTIKNQMQTTEQEIVDLRGDWATENAKVLEFNDDEFCCPTCQRAFEAGDVDAKKEELQNNFKAEKARKLREINDAGAAKSQTVTALKGRIQAGESHITTLKGEIESIKGKIEIETNKINSVGEKPSVETLTAQLVESNSQYQQLKIELAELEKQIQETPALDDAELKSQKATLLSEIQALRNELTAEAQIQRVNDRVLELEQEEQNLAQQIADIEKTEFVINNFNKHKIDTLENRINEKFRFVKFKLFETQINGGEVECCEALISGVPFSNANTASKINAGLDIINTLCEFFQVTAPIFIDNRESVISLIQSESQIINLIVSEPDKVLRVA